MGSSISTFEAVLGLLEVKHTESFTDQYFNEHPYRYNLLGLSIKAHRKVGTLNLLKKAVLISAFGMTVILVSIFAAGCSSNNQAKDGLPFIDVRRNYPEKEIILSDIAEVTYLHLNTDRDEYLYRGWIRNVTKNTIVVYDDSSGSILFFSRDGNPKSRFNHYGQGPYEYNNNRLLHLRILYDEEKDDVYVCGLNTMLIYSSTGEFKRKYTLPENVEAYSTIDFDDESFFVNLTPRISDWSLAYWDGVSDLEASSSYTRFYQISKTDGTLLDSLDMLSNVMQLYFKDDNGYTSTLGNYNRIIKSSNGLFLCNPDTDTIFLYAKDKSLTPIFHKKPPIQETNPKVVIDNWCEVGDFRFFRTISFQRDPVRKTIFTEESFFLDIKTREIFRQKIVLPDYKDKEFTICPFRIQRCNVTNGVCFELDLIELKQAYRENRLSGKLKEMVATLNENKDNNVFILAHFKK